MENIRSKNPFTGNGHAKADFSLPVDSVHEIHRRIFSTIEAVQAGIWDAGKHEVLGFATDFGFGRERGHQTLVLKTSHRSAYLRFTLETLLGTTDADRQFITECIRGAIVELT